MSFKIDDVVVPSFLETLSVYSTGIYRYDTPILYVHVTNSFKLAPQWAYGGWSLAPFHWSPGMKTPLDSDAFLTLLYRSQITVQTATPATFASHAGQHARLPQTLHVASDSTIPKKF